MQDRLQLILIVGMTAKDELICVAWGTWCSCFYASMQYIRRRTDILRVKPLCNNVTRRAVLAQAIEGRIVYNFVVLSQAVSSETLAC